MNLDSLGWESCFSRQVENMKQGFVPARVARENRGEYLLYSQHGELTAHYGITRHKAEERSSIPVVGDWVMVEARPDDGKAIIKQLLDRKSAFSRKEAWTRTEEQVIAANIDTVFIVCGLDADFQPRRVERYLTQVWNCGAVPVIILNKMDICLGWEELKEEIESIAFGVPVHAISAFENRGTEELSPYLKKGSTVTLVGSSGVGKSTLINSLLGEDRMKVKDTRQSDGRGQHTTTHRELIILPSGALLIDTPGMRELQLWSTGENVESVFRDIEELAEECRFRDCTHNSEPGCAVRKAIENGVLEEKRFENYLKLLKEQKYLERKQNVKARLEEKAKWKKITVSVRAKEKW